MVFLNLPRVEKKARKGTSYFLLLIAALLLTLNLGCQIPYIMKSAYSQADLLRHRVPLDEALQDPSLSAEQKRKIRLAREAREFAEQELGLKRSDNYTTFVKLNRPYVSYVVSASQRDRLEAYLWHFPLVGALPYKGYFDPRDAEEESRERRGEGLDTYVRGVSAFSTLGWFRDPILSSMLAYKDFQLVNTIIHETTHTTIYIRSEASFNERLATFIGNIGAEAFYRKKEGATGVTLKLIAEENQDDRIFAEFIKGELQSLDEWYKARSGQTITEDQRQRRFAEIAARFKSQVRPKLSSAEAYKGFENAEINNARLLIYRLYFEDLSLFERVFNKFNRDFKRLLSFAKSLENAKDPNAELLKEADGKI